MHKKLFCNLIAHLYQPSRSVGGVKRDMMFRWRGIRRVSLKYSTTTLFFVSFDLTNILNLATCSSMVVLPMFLHFVDGIFQGIVWGEVLDNEINYFFVSSQREGSAVLGCCLLSWVEKFLLPGGCISISHVGEDKKNFVQISGVCIAIRQEIYLDFLKKLSKIFSFTRERSWSFQLLLDVSRGGRCSQTCTRF